VWWERVGTVFPHLFALVTLLEDLDQWFEKWAVPPPGGGEKL